MENLTFLLMLLALSSATFLSYTIYSVYVLIKVRFNVENGAMVTIGMYFFCLGMKFIFWLLEVLQNTERTAPATYVPDTIGTYMIIAVYYYFIYEVKVVKLKLESDTPRSLQKNMVRLKGL